MHWGDPLFRGESYKTEAEKSKRQHYSTTKEYGKHRQKVAIQLERVEQIIRHDYGKQKEINLKKGGEYKEIDEKITTIITTNRCVVSSSWSK